MNHREFAQTLSKLEAFAEHLYMCLLGCSLVEQKWSEER